MMGEFKNGLIEVAIKIHGKEDKPIKIKTTTIINFPITDLCRFIDNSPFNYIVL